jgi:hypothetical protein
VIEPLPSSLAFEALSETMPTAIAPAEFSAEDFALEWDGPPLPGVEVRLQARSLEWVRVQDVLVLPRARADFHIARATKGSVSQASFSQPFVSDGASGLTAELPVALLSGEGGEIKIEIDGATAKLRVNFHPREGTVRGPTEIDPSCSRYGVTAVQKVPLEGKSIAQADWIYIGCRLVGSESNEHRTASLEVFVLWDGVGNSIQVEGLETPEASASVWLLRMRSKPGKVRLRGKLREIEVSYAIPENLHRGGLSAGIGPYSYFYQSDNELAKGTTAMLTLYGSYQLYDQIRAVAFDATMFNFQMISDFGLYISAEQFRTFDRRVALNLMLGAHVIGFRTNDDYLVIFGAPQGIELTISDFLGKNRNLGAGAFIYPSIGGKAYYNTWLRWGSPSFFGELNYISWEENREDRGRFYSQSVGVSIGFPLARFL